MHPPSKRSASSASTGHLMQLCVGYFAFYVLTGVLVKYFDPTSAGQSPTDQFATWDLNIQNGLPVASGIYIAYVEMPKLGITKTLKVVIIQEQQVLDFY